MKSQMLDNLRAELQEIPIRSISPDDITAMVDVRRRKRTRARVLVTASLVVVALSGLVAVMVRSQPSTTGIASSPPESTTSTEPSTTTTSHDTTTPVNAFAEGPLKPRAGHSMAWSGSELLIWGGFGDERGSTRYADGAAFDPATSSWRTLPSGPLEPRWNALTVWTDTEMLIFGGMDPDTEMPVGGIGASFEPSDSTWRTATKPPFDLSTRTPHVWDGHALFVFDPAANQAARYMPDSDTWSKITPPPVNLETVRLVATETGIVAIANSCGQLSAAVLNPDGSWNPPVTTLWETPAPNVVAYKECIERANAVDSARVLVSAEPTPAGTANAKFDTTTKTWTLEVPYPAECGYGPTHTPLDDVTIEQSACGVDTLIDSNGDRSIINLPAGIQDMVWTGTEFLQWGVACCYGAASPTEFTIMTARIRP